MASINIYSLARLYSEKVMIQSVAQHFNLQHDKHMYGNDTLPLMTIYDDNWFVRNDYDILSMGQRQYVQNVLVKNGFKLRSGKEMYKGDISVHFPKPKRILALSSFEEHYLENVTNATYVVTPTTFAECLFYQTVRRKENSLEAIKTLINKCPYNIELLRDISIYTEIEQITIDSYHELMRYQKAVVEKKFKRKKAL